MPRHTQTDNSFSEALMLFLPLLAGASSAYAAFMLLAQSDMGTRVLGGVAAFTAGFLVIQQTLASCHGIRLTS